MAGIISWGAYIPKYRVKAEEIAKAWGTDAEEIMRSLKISEKSVPSIDEDAATMAVEASRNALSGRDAREVGAIYIGSESHPYAVKPTGTIVGQALGIGNKYTTADFEFACKAGTAAIQSGLAMVNSGYAKLVLAGGSDTAQARAGDPLEYTAAAGAAMFLLGKEGVAAEINHFVSYTSDTPDFWRKNNSRYPSHAGSFTADPAYYRHIVEATNLLFQKAKSKPEDYDYVIFHQPNGKFPSRVAQKLGFTEKQISQGMLVDKIGNAYSASSLLGLCSVLDRAAKGERILLTSYGSGAGSDSFDITIAADISQKPKPVISYISKKTYITYPAYLRNTGHLQ